MLKDEDKNKVNWLPRQSNIVKPLISICIPTFNRSEYLNFLLNGICLQVGAQSENIEIVVSDNASTDSTYNIVLEQQEKGINIRYSRSYRNLGLDRNIRNSVRASTGRYCWLMGDDDAVNNDAISMVVQYLKIYNPEIIIGNRVMCDDNLNVISYTPDIETDEQFLLYDCIDRNNLIDYFNKTRSTTGMFNFLSTIIVNRDSWLKSPELPGMSQSLFPHVYKIMDILRNQAGRLMYLNQPLVYARHSNRLNDELSPNSEFKGWQAHFSGNIEVADHFYSDHELAYTAFLSPVIKIIKHGKDAYLNMANADGKLEEALIVLKKLKLA